MRLGQKAFLFVALLTLSACAPTCATVCEQLGVGWISYTDVDGIRAIAFSADGDLWAADGKGVIRWDVCSGTYTRYTSADGLLEDEVWAVAAGLDGVMWFGSKDGVSYFDGERWGTYTTAHGLPEGYVVSIAVSPDGGVWVVTYQVGVSHFDGETWTVYTEAERLACAVETVSVAPDGTVWVGGWSIARFDGVTWTGYALPYDYFTDLDTTSPTSVIAIAPDGWLATDGYFFHFDDVAWFNYHSRDSGPRGRVTSIAIAPDGALWFGTEERGVSRFDGETWTAYTTADGLASDHVTAIAVASDGALWFGTDAGLSRYQPPD